MEQRNPYKGDPPRPWVTVVFHKADGSDKITKQLLADTGGVAAIRISRSLLYQIEIRPADIQDTNFGLAEGSWVWVEIPELGFRRQVIAYGLDRLVSAVKESHPDFEGSVGLPFLREFEYGGNESEFWIRNRQTMTS
ncbi:MAG: hypothetical protein ONB44_22870 [candidate division KSB1 bacterium]|nr:hypothetical protein [candidate division KSB1 bacterium]MDZ7304982.1 hypothetical protein [candidate division KSB1 bacterium]MDZ7314025.1 hypothetical protein [candidate division KSB1 bacterium]